MTEEKQARDEKQEKKLENITAENEVLRAKLERLQLLIDVKDRTMEEMKKKTDLCIRFIQWFSKHQQIDLS